MRHWSEFVEDAKQLGSAAGSQIGAGARNVLDTETNRMWPAPNPPTATPEDAMRMGLERGDAGPAKSLLRMRSNPSPKPTGGYGGKVF